ncbi:hypothetical protein AAHA92_12626 [Salvia divinorum]|uniref:Uncharacterized protein n=1 Tax=Salvia divinorum TaxID=28513 RepID=A0ABD1HKV7_SALDI
MFFTLPLIEVVFVNLQRKAVRDMGFEALLRFTLADLPGILAHWIVLNFEIASSSIVLTSSNKLHVDVEDVHVTLGFPKGSLEIRRKKRLESHSFADALAERVGKDKMQLLDTDVENEMYADSKGGNNFKRCFLMLMENALIETPRDGYLKPKITSFVDDVSNVADYNWCNYTLSVIFSTRKNWELRKEKHFSGPVVFLVLCYMDRMDAAFWNKESPIVENELDKNETMTRLDDIDSNTTTKGVVEDVVSPGVDKIGVTETTINRQQEHRRHATQNNKISCIPKESKCYGYRCEGAITRVQNNQARDINCSSKESGKNTKAALKQQATDKEKVHFPQTECHTNPPKNEGKKMKVYTSMAKGKALVQNDACTHNANKPSLRIRSNMGAPEMLRSPFNDRAITMGYHLAVEEKKVYYWVLSTKNEATELIVYNNHDIIVTYEDIASLVPYCKITVGVIDAWCCHLNDMEHLRGPSSPSRLFITSAICTYTIVQPRAHWNEKMAMSKFRERILDEFKYIGNFQLCAYNLIFFPIYASDHHYLVCFNFLKPAMTIIDSAKSPDNDYGIEKYGD